MLSNQLTNLKQQICNILLAELANLSSVFDPNINNFTSKTKVFLYSFEKLKVKLKFTL